MRHVSTSIELPSPVILVVGREQYAVPASFGGQACVATADCVAVGVLIVDGSTQLRFSEASPGEDTWVLLGRFDVETEGLLSVREVWNREYQTVGAPAGLCSLTVWGNDEQEPGDLVLEVSPER